LKRFEINVPISIPQKWNDLTEWQLRMVGHFLFLNRTEETEKTLFKNVLLFILAFPKPSFKNITKVIILFYYFSFRELEHHTDFIFDQEQRLTRFPEFIKVGKWPFRKKLYGPAPRLANVTINELSYADTFFYKWITESETDELHRLTAILYRPKSKRVTQDDIRVEFSNLTLEKNAEFSDQIPLHVKYMIAHCYQGCREMIIDRHPNVFPKKKVSEADDEPQVPVTKKPYQPFSRIIDSMAMDEVQVFGNHQETEKVYAPKFLAVYEEKIKKQKELDRNRK